MGFLDHEPGINTSYAYGTDNYQGWGDRYFFTFYTEFGNRDFELIIELFILIIIFICSLILNIFVLLSVLLYPVLQTITNYFLLNLTAADILFILGIPAIIYARISSSEWPLGNIFCKILPYSQFVCGFVLLWTLTFISMDRYYCIVVSPYRSKLTPKRAAFLTITTWLVGCILFFPVILWFRVQKVSSNPIVLNDHLICTIIFPNVNIISLSTAFTIGLCIFCCILPLTLLIYYYYCIFNKLNQTKRIWSNSHISSIQHNRHTKVVRMLLSSVIVVLSMWLPIFIVMFLIYIDGSRPTRDINFFLRSHHFLWSLLLALFNTVVNPILYGTLSNVFSVCLSKRNKCIINNTAPSVIRTC